MDIQKTLVQAEQLFKRGKTQEAIEKYEAVLFEDQNNEVAANKLALVYISINENNKAIQLYCDIAKRASEKGKSQKSIALYRQALAIDANNPKVLVGLAEESEILGKFSEAAKICEQLVRYYLPRKKYLDIIHVCNRWNRCEPKNNEVKSIWLNTVRILSDESLLTQALITFCGPPGLVSGDQHVGGDPKNLSDETLELLFELIRWFPNNPRVPYSLAWVEYKKNNFKKMYEFLFETFKKDPDYSLGTLLFCRTLAEHNKTEESQYLYKYIKEAITRDQKTGIKVLTEQLNNFEKNHAWLSFNEGLGNDSALSNEYFLKKIKNIPTDPVKGNEEKTDVINKGDSKESDGEIHIGLPGENFNTGNEINIDSGAGGDSVIEFNVRDIDLSAKENINDSNSTEVDLPNDSSSTNNLFESYSQNINLEPPKKESKPPEKFSALDSSLQDFIQKEKQEDNEDTLNIKKPETVKNENQDDDDSTKTKLFSPQDLVQAVRWEKSIHAQEETKTSIAVEEESKPVASNEHEYTSLLSNTSLLRPKIQIELETKKTIALMAGEKEEAVEGNTVMFVPIPTVANPTKANPTMPPPISENLRAATEENKKPANIPIANDLAISDSNASFYDSDANTMQIRLDSPLKKETIDLDNLIEKGDDYLKTNDYYSARKTFRDALSFGASESLVKEKLKLVRDKEAQASIYQNYSVDQSITAHDVQSIINNLVIDFDIHLEEENLTSDVKKSLKKIRENIETQIKDCNPKMRLDLGIAFYEMGMYEEAENQFLKIESSQKEFKFDSYYLAAQAMRARRSYNAAINLLKKIVDDLDTKQDKSLAIFYLMGELYEDVADKELSKKYFDLVAQIDSNYRNIRAKLGVG